MKKRIKVNTRDLSVGDVFYISEDNEHVMTVLAQGPEYYIYRYGGYDSSWDLHRDVWVERATVVDFAVCEEAP